MSAQIRYTDSYIQKIKDKIAELEKQPKIDFNTHLLPKPTSSTMSEAIAMSSPNGRMSKRAKDRTTKRLGKALFGDWTPGVRHEPKIAKRISDLYHVLRLMELVNRGMKPRKYPKEIDRIVAFIDF